MALLPMIRTKSPQGIYVHPARCNGGAVSIGWGGPLNPGTPRLGYFFQNVGLNPWTIKPAGFVFSSQLRLGQRFVWLTGRFP